MLVFSIYFLSGSKFIFLSVDKENVSKLDNFNICHSCAMPNFVPEQNIIAIPADPKFHNICIYREKYTKNKTFLKSFKSKCCSVFHFQY